MAQSAGLINFANAPLTVGTSSAATLTATNVTVAGSLTANAVASTNLTVSGNIAVTGNLALTTGTMTLGTTSLTGAQLATIEALPNEMIGSNQFNQGLKGLVVYVQKQGGGSTSPSTTCASPANRAYSAVQIAEIQTKNTFTVDETKVYPPLYNMMKNTETNYNSFGDVIGINELTAVPKLTAQASATGFNFNGMDSSYNFSPMQTFVFTDDSGVVWPTMSISEPHPQYDIRSRVAWSVFVNNVPTTYAVHVQDASGSVYSIDASGWSMTITPFAEKANVKLMQDRMAQYYNLSTVVGAYGMYSLNDSSMNYTRCTAPQQAAIDSCVNSQIDSSLNTIRNTTISLTAPGGDVMNFKYVTYIDENLEILDGLRANQKQDNMFGVLTRPISVTGHYVPTDVSGTAVYVRAFINTRFRKREYSTVCHGSCLQYLDVNHEIIKIIYILDDTLVSCPPTNIKELPKEFDGAVNSLTMSNYGIGASFCYFEHLPNHDLKSNINLRLDLSGGVVVATTDASGNAGYKIKITPKTHTTCYVNNQDYSKGRYYQIREYAYQMPFGSHYDKQIDYSKTNLVFTPSTNTITGDIFYVKPRLLSIPDSTNPDYQTVAGYPVVYVGTNVTWNLTADDTMAFGKINTHYVLTRNLTTGLYLDTSGGYTGTPQVTTKNLYSIPSSRFDTTVFPDVSLCIESNDNVDGMYFQGNGNYGLLVANPAWMQLDVWCRAGADASGNTAAFTPVFNLTRDLYDSSNSRFGMSGRNYYSTTYKVGVDQGPSMINSNFNSGSYVVYQQDYATVNFSNINSYAAGGVENNVLQSVFYEKTTGHMASPWVQYQFNVQTNNGVQLTVDSSNNPLVDASGVGMWASPVYNLGVRGGLNYGNFYIDQALNFKVVATGVAGWEVPIKLATPETGESYYLMNNSYRSTDTQSRWLPGPVAILRNEGYMIDVSNNFIPFLDWNAGPNGFFFESTYWTVDTSGLYPGGSGYLANRQNLIDDFGYDQICNIMYLLNLFFSNMISNSAPGVVVVPGSPGLPFNAVNPNPKRLLPVANQFLYPQPVAPLPDYIRKSIIYANRPRAEKVWRQWWESMNFASQM